MVAYEERSTHLLRFGMATTDAVLALKDFKFSFNGRNYKMMKNTYYVKLALLQPKSTGSSSSNSEEFKICTDDSEDFYCVLHDVIMPLKYTDLQMRVLYNNSNYLRLQVVISQEGFTYKIPREVFTELEEIVRKKN